LPSYRIHLGDLAGRIQAFHEMRSTLTLPDFADCSTVRFMRLIFVRSSGRAPARPGNQVRCRGSLAEFIKQKHFGRYLSPEPSPSDAGNHYHHTKTEKFFVVEGVGLIRMRALKAARSGSTSDGQRVQVIDIPPGFTHSITNVAKGFSDPVLGQRGVQSRQSRYLFLSGRDGDRIA